MQQPATHEIDRTCPCTAHTATQAAATAAGLPDQDYNSRLATERAAFEALAVRTGDAEERATRMRQHAERERRGLQAQVGVMSRAGRGGRD
jgi:hypothetical protein